MARSINYSRVNWKDYPNTDTPKTAANFNVMDKGIDDLDVAVADRALKTEAIKSISRFGTTFTATRCDGTTFTFTQQDNNTTYSNFSRSAAGLVPAAPSGSGTTKYLREDGSWAVPPDNNTTYESKAAASGGTAVSLCTTGEKYTWNSKAAGNHTHTASIAADSGTNQLTMAASTKYKLTAGGSSFIFTTPPDNNTNTWRGCQNNFTSTATDQSLSANMGRILAEEDTWYCTCSTAATTAAKSVVSANGKFVLKTGAKIAVKFTEGNIAFSNFTLNVDQTGAKGVLVGKDTVIDRGLCVPFVYDGTYWVYMGMQSSTNILYDFIVLKTPTSFAANTEYSYDVSSALSSRSGYYSFPFVYAEGQNHIYTSLNNVNDKWYLNVINKYTTTLNARIVANVLFVRTPM